MSEVAAKVQAELGSVDIVVHSLANGPEVAKPLLDTSRKVGLGVVGVVGWGVGVDCMCINLQQQQ